MRLEELRAELEETWTGSGYGIKYICRLLENKGFAWAKPFEESVPRVFYCALDDGSYVVNVTMDGYQILQEVRT